MDITPFLELKPAPRAVFDTLEERRSRPRFYVPEADGGFAPVTWGTYAEQIRRTAAYVTDAGLAPGDRGAVFAVNSVAWGAAALGIQAAGGVMVPVYPASTPEQAAYILEHSDSKVVFVDAPVLLERLFGVWDRLGKVTRIVTFGPAVDPVEVWATSRLTRGDAPGDLRERVVPWSRMLEEGAERLASERGLLQRLLDGIDLDQPGLMLYTSGTTGNPKGVPLTHRNVAVNGRDWLECNEPIVHDDAVDVLWLPMSHIFGFGELCLGNTLGFTTYLADPYTVLELLPRVRPTVFMSVPAYWEKLAQGAMAEDDPERRRQRLVASTGGRLKLCLSGGAGLKKEVKELFYECGVLIVEGYGLTECSPTLTLNRPGHFRFDTVGRPLPSVELELADDGEILARGPNVFGGYHKDPEATRAAFTADGWFRTGDVGRFTEDGFLQIIDRKKDILVTAGGKNVPPANIETRFADDPYIAAVVVYGDGKKYLVAGVWPNTDAVRQALDGADTPDAVHAFLARRIEAVNATLARHETIKRFCVMDRPLTVEDGLLTASLKIRRKKIYEAFRDRFEALYTEAAQPATAPQPEAR